MLRCLTLPAPRPAAVKLFARVPLLRRCCRRGGRRCRHFQRLSSLSQRLPSFLQRLSHRRVCCARLHALLVDEALRCKPARAGVRGPASKLEADGDCLFKSCSDVGRRCTIASLALVRLSRGPRTLTQARPCMPVPRSCIHSARTAISRPRMQRCIGWPTGSTVRTPASTAKGPVRMHPRDDVARSGTLSGTCMTAR